MLYLIAPTKTAKDEWKGAFLKGEGIDFGGWLYTSIEKLNKLNLCNI